MPSTSSFTAQFNNRKRQLLAGLDSDLRDASPKGHVDDEIKDLVNLLNQYDGMVTTSSCAGRVACYLEGVKTKEWSEQTETHQFALDDNESRTEKSQASLGGKGAGGKWLFVSHVPLLLDNEQSLLQKMFNKIPLSSVETNSSQSLSSREIPMSTRFVRLKFEPMILHILASDIKVAQTILTCAFNSSFRESGIINATSLPLVAVRTPSLGFDAPIGIYDSQQNEIHSLVSEDTIRILLRLANARFNVNKDRTNQFEAKIRASQDEALRVVWESSTDRADRLRREGLKLQKILGQENGSVEGTSSSVETHDAVNLHEIFP